MVIFKCNDKFELFCNIFCNIFCNNERKRFYTSSYHLHYKSCVYLDNNLIEHIY